MSWIDRMSKASFRGFEFLTDSHSADYGRRLAVHEFPGGEVEEVQDLGAKSPGWKLNAYFIGPDYDLERNALIAKLAEPGADWLTHPWLGLLWVRAHKWSLSESNKEGGYCTLAIEFVAGGGELQPTQDMVDTAISRTRELQDVVVDDFELEEMQAGGMASFLAAVHAKLDVLRNVLALATLPLTWAGQIQGLIAGIKGDLAELMALPDAYANALRGLGNALGGGADTHGMGDTERPRVVARLTTAATTLTPAPDVADDAVLRNLRQEETLRSWLLVTAAAEIALTDYRAEPDRDAALASVAQAIEALLPGLPDPVFHAAVATRAALTNALLAQDLKPALERDVVHPLPAVLLAHRLEVDEDVFLARNAVRHPLFVRGRVYG